MPSLRAQLAQVQGRLEEAEKHIEDQIVLIEQLRADRHYAGAAEHFLATLIDLLTKLTLHRNKLEARLKLARPSIEPSIEEVLEQQPQEPHERQSSLIMNCRGLIGGSNS